MKPHKHHTTPQPELQPAHAKKTLTVPAPTVPEWTVSPAEVPLDDLIDWADKYWRRGWRPFPARIEIDAAGKKDLRPIRWAEHKTRRLDLDDVLDAFRNWRRKKPANAVCICLEAGHLVADCDTQEAKDLLQSLAPEQRGLRTRSIGGGAHYHFQAPPHLIDFGEQSQDLIPGLHLLGPGKLVIMPPSLHLALWDERPHTVDLPELPPLVAAILNKVQTIPPTAALPAIIPLQPTTGEDPPRSQLPNDFEALLSILPDLTRRFDSNGREWYGATCPFPDHRDVSPSFRLYHGQRDGAWLWKCRGCQRSGTLTGLRRLQRQAGGFIPTSSFRRAYDAVASQPDLRPAVRSAFVWLITDAQNKEIDLSDPEGISASFRQLAKVTGLEVVSPDGKLSQGGRKVKTVIRAMVRAGATLIPGVKGFPPSEEHPLGQGRAQRFVLPAAWVYPDASDATGTAAGASYPTLPPTTTDDTA